MTHGTVVRRYSMLGLGAAACLTTAACTAPNTRSAAATPAATVTGTYSWAPSTIDSTAGCRLQVEQRGADSLRYDLGCNRGAPSYNSGSASGIVPLNTRTAVLRFTDYGSECTISMSYADTSVTVLQTGSDSACGFGFGVYASGPRPTVYRKVSSAVPAFEAREH